MDRIFLWPLTYWADHGSDGIMVSSRIRLARNLANYRFPQALDREGLREIYAKIIPLFSGYKIYNYEELSSRQKNILVEKHLVSREHILANYGSGLAISRDEDIAIMINEEDHLRIQALAGGMCLREDYEKAMKIARELDEKLHFAISDKFGFLTACPTNTGTGLRASVMLHLPALQMSGKLDALFAALPRYGLTVRGLYGEGSQASGNLFQLSNQRTLGITGEELVTQVVDIACRIAEQERAERDMLFRHNKREMTDYVYRAYGLLRYSYLLSGKEMMDSLSAVSMGASMDVIKGLTQEDVNEMLISGKPSFLQGEEERPLGSNERDFRRAAKIREFLSKK